VHKLVSNLYCDTEFAFLQDEIDAFFQSPPDVVKDVKEKSRKHRSMKDTRSKISTKGVKRNKSRNQNIVVDASQSTSDEFENIDKPIDNPVKIKEKIIL